MKTKMKLKLALAFVAMAMATTACDNDDKKDGGGGGSGGSGDVCVTNAKACSVGQQFSQGYYLAATENGGILDNLRTINLKLSFYAKDGDALYRNATNTDLFYSGLVEVNGLAVIDFEEQNLDEEEISFRTGGNSCRIDIGEYIVTSVENENSYWQQEPSSRDNVARVNNVRLQLVKGDDVIQAKLDGAKINTSDDAKEGFLVLDGGKLTVTKFNNKRCNQQVNF